jgi:dissimilatory sulfite reductase (desulfoviridin) alpha/beta subunit
VLAGGNGGGRPRLAKEVAKGLSTDEAVALVDRIVEYYKANGKPHQRLGSMIEKMGFDEFESAVLGG